MINWLASYPKSGNTWVRLFLDAYVLDKDIDINCIQSIRGDQQIYMYNTEDIDITKIDNKFRNLARGFMLIRMNEMYGDGFDNSVDGMHLPLIIKTHMANIIVNDAKMIPKVITDKIIYLVRDPRKVVISYAKHLNKSLDETIDILCDTRQGLNDITGKLNALPTYVTSWDMHYNSYLEDKKLNVYLVKYEDLIKKPDLTFTFILNALNIKFDKDRMLRAIDRCSLYNLKKQEKEKGFTEKPEHDYNFFGDTTKLELTEKQENKLVKKLGSTMKKLNYI